METDDLQDLLDIKEIGRYALKWGERLRILGGDGRLGQVTPPA
jgi:hypothetical protein